MDAEIEGGDGGGKGGGGKDCANNADEASSSSSTCPLFMSGLPSDFASNPSLAAIASLLGDEEYDSDVDIRKVRRKGLRADDGGSKTVSGGGAAAAAAAAAGKVAAATARPRVGGGKVGGAGAARRNNNKSGSRKKSGAHHRPYPTAEGKKEGEGKQKASVGEAQLFLNMWKL